ncbi:hypothetical protein FJU08_01320 [Martelella alba]|uniref:Uncharacterized protein n=1 Tax=Martelella alba TaxID=2590451 RepID=A0A506UIZ5_9HYPH|nr:hypothetical protein [Martelella alba]TPW33233.1 hypothetical protein FJU08_01320 [Martelella alba]
MNKQSENTADEGSGEFADAGAAWERREAERLGRDRKAKPRRKPGRPPGSTNKRSRDLLALQEEKGYADPVEALMQYCTMPAEALHAWICERESGKKPSLWEVMQHQASMRVQLAPFLHAKIMSMPAAIEELLPLLMINLGTNQLDQARQIAEQKGIPIGSPLLEGKANENK